MSVCGRVSVCECVTYECVIFSHQYDVTVCDHSVNYMY